jgi:uncharacterized membrane protein
MSHLHPMTVHFPIALIFVTFAIDLAGKVLKRDKFMYAGTITTVFALASAIAAVITGLVTEDTGWHPASVAGILETHELMGFIVLGLVAVLAIVRLAFHDKLDTAIGWLPVVIGGVAIVFVTYGGYLGGEMVFTHGAAVKPAEECARDKAVLEGKLKAMERSDKAPVTESETAD